MNLLNLIEQAKKSSFNLWKLNFILGVGIPFNKPHGIKIVELGDGRTKSIFPYKRRNHNHLRGLHACGLAALSEFTAGITLMSKVDAAKYRLIMKELKMEYFYQGKADAFAEYTVTDEWLNSSIVKPLETEEFVYIDCVVKVIDSKGNHLCTGTSHWQLKRWDKVKTKM